MKSTTSEHTSRAAIGSPTQHASDDFYVGYLPTPKSHASTLRIIVPALLLSMAGIASLVAYSQRDPGTGSWNSATEQFSGVAIAHPAPMLIVNGTHGPQALLLVEEGKHGSLSRIASFNGKHVDITGTRISRKGRTIVEIAAGTESVKVSQVRDTSSVEADALFAQPRPTSDNVILRGEIIDSKCYHGAMKPGEGKAHKACATLCISNGIPAMFAATSADGTLSFYLLAIRNAGQADAQSKTQFDADTLSKIGELVEVSGSVSRIADLDVLTIEPGSVRRLP